MLQEATRTAARHNFRVAVNTSPTTLRQADFVPYVQACLEGSGLAPEGLIIEVTEGVLAQPETMLPILQALGKQGVRIVVGDFGIAYSSLGYLLHYPLSALKIDRKFVSQLDNPKGGRIAQAIVKLAQSLELQTVAEGVETEAQLRWAMEAGCEYVQGYLLAKPMPLEEFLCWRDTGPRLPAPAFAWSEPGS